MKTTMTTIMKIRISTLPQLHQRTSTRPSSLSVRSSSPYSNPPQNSAASSSISRKPNSLAPDPNASPKQSKFSTTYNRVKEVPMVSIFDSAGSSIASGENTLSNSKEFVQRYLRKIKPLYVRVLSNKDT